jgi:hypothetical protein
MKSPLSVALAVTALATIAFACSSSPSRPPIDTTGGGPAPGSGSPKPDAATPTNEDAGTPVTPVADGGTEAGVCSAGGCGGCCNAINQCVAGTTIQACGVLGVPCVMCMAGSNCTGGYCQ